MQGQVENISIGGYQAACRKHGLPVYPEAVVGWDAPGLRFTRVRLLSDLGCPFWSVSYCYGYWNGKHVRVQLPFSNIPRGKQFREFLYREATRDGIQLNKSGFFKALSTLCV